MRPAIVSVALALGLAGAATAQAQRPYAAPLDSLGRPDLTGAWTNATLTPQTREASVGGRAAYTPEEVRKIEGDQQAGLEAGNLPIDNSQPLAKGGILTPRGGTQIAGNYDRAWFDPGSRVMRVNGEPRTSLLTTPDGRVPPRKAGAPPPGGGRGGGSGRDNPETMSLGDRCLTSFGRNTAPPMMSNGFYNNNYQIVQSRDAVAIMTEMVHDARVIRLNAAHRTDGVRPWFGDSVGRYEGRTLVVETVNLPQAQAYNGAWRNLKVTERFTRVAPDRLLYQFTIEDPDNWDRPWGGEYEFAAQRDRIFEYACHEGNYAMEGILAGARAEERRQAAR